MSVLLVGGLFVFWGLGFVKADVPSEYIANYQISDSWEKILELFVKIDAMIQVWTEIPSQTFKELNWHFTKVFGYFPTDYAFKVIYEQCLLTTQSLWNGYSHTKLSVFMESCYTPFQGIVKQINSQYTVIASAKVSPSSGPAPLTVTFDARSSVDPSNETIPENNFYWYYRDVDWVDKVIWNKNVVSYTFEKAGNYIIHLTVRSSNKIAKWIFDWEQTLSVNVSPMSAIITMYANGKKLNPDKIMKLWVQEAQRWVVLDATATIPVGWRQIMSNILQISSDVGYVYVEESVGVPSVYNVSLWDKWEYVVELTTIDNEWNKVSQSYSLVVSDPVSVIRQTPEKWNTSMTFAFDASASYSVVSRLRLYTWEVFDQQWDKIQTVQGKDIKQKFEKPGTYTVKLTVEDLDWKTDISTTQVFVDSTDPVAQFKVSPKTETKLPSEFILDARSSSDFDEANWNDKLSYDWKFSTDQVNIFPQDQTNEVIVVSFDEIGIHKATLTVSDSYWKITEIQKDIDVKSILRPELLISPKATQRGEAVSMAVKVNKPIVSYEWDFWDWDKRTVQTNKISHIYKKVGQYIVKLKVVTANWDSNEIESIVFVWEKDSPVASYKVTDASQILTQNDVCQEIIDGVSYDRPSYRVDRYSNITIDPSESVNANWTNSDLSIYFQPKNDEIYKKTTYSYAFDELWCQFVDLTVEDVLLAKNDKVRVWFKVMNALPTLDNLLLFFPQYGNEMWVGFQENNVKDIFSSNFDPLMVKVTANWSEDPDWFITYYKWYYYYKDDPARYLETKITPSDIPYAFFSLPRVPWEFMFGVAMYDSDDGKRTSEDVIWNWPIVFFPPDVQRPDIPLVTLKADRLSTEVWEEVQFDVISKIVSDKPDFVKERTIQYDFDWDWVWDLTTKKDRVTHVYEIANEDWYTPRASVIYRWYKWIGKWGSIVVKKWLKPRLLFDVFDKYVIFREMSIGEITEKEICLNMRLCSTEDSYLIKDAIAFDFEFPDYGKYVSYVDISDKHANEASKRWVLDLTWQSYSWAFHIMSIPLPTFDSWNNNVIEFFVGKSLENSILFNVLFDDLDWSLDCYVDADISIDTNEDGVNDQDRDFNCNELHLEVYEPRYDSVVGRVYYQSWDTLSSEDFLVSFLDFQVDLDPEKKELYDKIFSLIMWIDTSQDVNEYLKSLLISLKEWLLDDIDTKWTVVAIQDYLTTHEVVLSDSQKADLDVVLTALSDESVLAAQWATVYEQAKGEILSILPVNLATEVGQLFRQFETTEWVDLWTDVALTQQEHRKKILQDVVNLISTKVAVGSGVSEDQIDSFDMENIVMPNICKILEFYEIPSENCSSENLQAIPDDVPEQQEEKKHRSWVRTLFIILWIGIWIFVALVVAFVIKAKLSAKDAVEEPEDKPAW